MSDIGPIHVLVIAFPEPHLSGRILDELRVLRAEGLVRLVDVVFVQKTDDGAVVAVEVSELSDEEAATFGDLTGALVGLGEVDLDGDGVPDELDDEVWDLAETIPAGSAAAVVLLEHRWAAGLSRAVAESGGELVDDELIPPAALDEIDADFAAAVRART